LLKEIFDHGFGGHGPIPPKFDNGLAVAGYNSKMGVLDKNGEIIVPFEYSESQVEIVIKHKKTINAL